MGANDYVISKALRNLDEVAKNAASRWASARVLSGNYGGLSERMVTASSARIAGARLNQEKDALGRVMRPYSNNAAKTSGSAKSVRFDRASAGGQFPHKGKLGVESGAAQRMNALAARRQARIAALKPGKPGRPVLP